MALAVNSSILQFTGKLGNIVGYIRNGKQFYRALPRKSTKEPTPMQIAQKTRFRMTHDVLRPINPLVSTTFKHRKNRAGHNLAFAYTIGNVITGPYPDYAINWSKLLISNGTLFPAAQPEAMVDSGRIIYQWKFQPFNNYHQMDQVILAVYCPELKQCIYTIGSAERKCAGAGIDVQSFSGYTVHTYIGFISPNKKLASRSQYTGSFTII